MELENLADKKYNYQRKYVFEKISIHTNKQLQSIHSKFLANKLEELTWVFQNTRWIFLTIHTSTNLLNSFSREIHLSLSIYM